jgi:8-oxo-dGTP pyrophosphatase MutT (NUDIX family)
METEIYIKDWSFWIIPLIKDFSWIKVLLVQHGRWHWGFPKWHKEGDESDLETALREFTEETGIKEIEIVDGVSFSNQYRFSEDWKRYDKTVVYFPWFIKNFEVTIQEWEIRGYKFVDLKGLLSLGFPENARKMIDEIIRCFWG